MYIIVDFNHWAYKYFYGTTQLTSVLKLDGVDRVVDTTIAYHTIRALNRFGENGKHFIGICHEGGSDFRKQYFNPKENGGTGYKDGRASINSQMLESMQFCEDLLRKCNAVQYRQQGYEADDLIYTVIQKIKAFDTVNPIMVITGDHDMLPLVDNQVTVLITSKTGNRVNPVRGYFRVTPSTWNEYMAVATKYRDYNVPYNSILLYKLIKGDDSDKIAGAVKGYGPKKYSALMDRMIADEVDFSSIFRYGVDFDEAMKPVLSKYFDETVVERMKFIYGGMCLREFDGDLPRPKQLSYDTVKYVCSCVDIKNV